MYEFPHRRWPLDADTLDWSIGLLRWGGFWAAILLPLVHVPLLVTSGLTAASTPALLALWTANAVALVLGRQHSPHGRPSFGGADRR
jgi:hypothetical protein